MDSGSAKPISEFKHSEHVRLPEITAWRKLVRWLINGLVRLLVALFARVDVHGLENVPHQGPALVVANHLGDSDDLLKIAFLPRQIEAIAKVDLLDVPILGQLMQAYGVIWIRRGRPDRRALRAALQGLAEGRLVMINPEGRESLSGALEEATEGAAFLALKANAPILPLAITGTQNHYVYLNLRRLRRTTMTLTVGKIFYLASTKSGEGHRDRDDSGAPVIGVERGDPSAPSAFEFRQAAITRGTRQIMQVIADMLPDEYRGFYSVQPKAND